MRIFIYNGMKISKSFILLLVFGILVGKANSQDQQTKVPKILPSEIQILLGKWKGKLTYLDYTSGKPYTMPVELEVEKGKNEFELRFIQSYPNEPKANNKGKIKISKDGTTLDAKPVLSKKEVQDGGIEIVVEYNGKDGNENKDAIIRQTYLLSKMEFINRKEVRFLDQDNWILRNEFKYSRN